MEFVFEKIHASSTDKNGLINIYSVGKKVNEAILCIQSPWDCSLYLGQLNLLIENMGERQTLTDEEEIAFFHLYKENKNLFLLFDQISRKKVQKFTSLKELFFYLLFFLR